MKLSVSIIATTVLASMAVAAPPNVASKNIVSERAGRIARDACANAEPNTDKTSGETEDGSSMDYSQTRDYAYDEMKELARDILESCDTDWFDVKAFDRFQGQWSSRLAEIENKYKGKLPGDYNVDKEIENLRQQYSTIEDVRSLRKNIGKNYGPSGVQAVAISELSAKISSIYDISGKIPDNVDIDEKVSKFEKELLDCHSVTNGIRNMPEEMMRIYNNKAKYIKTQLDELKTIAQQRQQESGQK